MAVVVVVVVGLLKCSCLAIRRCSEPCSLAGHADAGGAGRWSRSSVSALAVWGAIANHPDAGHQCAERAVGLVAGTSEGDDHMARGLPSSPTRRRGDLRYHYGRAVACPGCKWGTSRVIVVASSCTTSSCSSTRWSPRARVASSCTTSSCSSTWWSSCSLVLVGRWPAHRRVG